jgi:hypothetical protein
VRRTPNAARWVAVAAFVAVAAVAPQAVPDPRTAHSGSEHALAAPASWLRMRIADGDVVFPSSPVFLAALPEARRALPLPREQPILVTRALGRARFPRHAAFVAVPLDGTTAIPGSSREVFPSWLIVRLTGPFEDRVALLTALLDGLDQASSAVARPTPRLAGYVRQSRATLCGALRAAGGRCTA